MSNYGLFFSTRKKVTLKKIKEIYTTIVTLKEQAVLTCVTSAFFCNSPDGGEPVKSYQRGTLQNIATVIDMIAGFGLIFAGFSLHVPALTLVGSLQIWPLMAFVTIALFSCRQGLQKENFYVKFRPCSLCSSSKLQEIQ